METLPSVKVCDRCRTKFQRRLRQNKDWWSVARFCSERCMQAARKPPPQLCPSCGVEFLPTHGKSRPQKFCSISCANTAKGINPKTTRYKRAPSNGRSTTAHRAMVEQKMGVKLPIEIVVHHKDEDKIGNRFSNLDLMTQREHGLHHNPPKNPVTSACKVCGSIFTPHKTKRGRKQTCSPGCKIALLKAKWREHHPKR